MKPTGTCFDDINQIFIALWSGVSQDENEYLICHGICEFPFTGEKYAHAWIELNDFCYEMCVAEDGGEMICKLEIWDFFEKKGVKKHWIYSPRDALEMCKKHKNVGPWEMEALKLCSDYTEDMTVKGCRKHLIES